MTVEVIQEQITLYTQQLDSFDQLSTNYVMTAIGFVGVISAAIMAMLGARNKISSEGSGNNDGARCWDRALNRAISIAFLTFPGIMTLFMYVFAVNCRKVALYRGYLLHLEDLLQSKTGIPAESFFNTTSLEKSYGFAGDNASGIGGFLGESFLSMSVGPLVMAVFIAILLVVGFKISKYFATLSDGSLKLRGCEGVVTEDGKIECRVICYWSRWGKFKRYYYPIYHVLRIVSVVFIIVCLVDLLSNGFAMDVLHNALNDAAGLA